MKGWKWKTVYCLLKTILRNSCGWQGCALSRAAAPEAGMAAAPADELAQAAWEAAVGLEGVGREEGRQSSCCTSHLQGVILSEQYIYLFYIFICFIFIYYAYICLFAHIDIHNHKNQRECHA